MAVSATGLIEHPGWASFRPAADGSSRRSIDLIVAVGALVPLTPIMGLIAIAIRLESRGPALFRQMRGGYQGRPFRVYKFRTMVADAEEQRERLLAQSREQEWLHLDVDPRLTRAGRVLRRASLDELPQLLNVIRGEMSLVGPRPLPLAEDAAIPEWARQRREVLPGITGLWQVSGRTNLSFRDMLVLDCRYVAERSAWGDMRLLARTVPAMLLRRGAN